MRHTETDLRRFLTEHSQARDHGEPPAHLDAIVRRGRRIRRTRRMLTAGATLACAVAAVGLANSLLIGPQAIPSVAAQPPVDSAEVVEPGPKPPEEFQVVLGATKFAMPLLDSQRFDTMGAAQTVTFTPASHDTGFKVVCDDPEAWVVLQQRLKNGEQGGSSGRCKDGVGGHGDEKSVPSDWLEGPQSMKVWVFPADAPVEEVVKDTVACPKGMKECAEHIVTWGLSQPKVLERLSEEIGERPGRWAVGIYDRPVK
ncbi:hypothetical protein [Nonomuraea sp. NPDC050643]|uniref:hypothetical protein n=1 Tax=Nonomuraea sp. NPDC050643 TaxID=3155660 RepID=UPI0033E69DE1